MSLTATLYQRNWIKGLGHAVVAIAVCSLLAACSSTSRSTTTVVDRNAQQKPTVTSGQYVVRPGDTLYSIAFRYGWDWKALAARNNISAPYTIRPGQAIRFDGGSSTTPSVAKNTTPVAPVVVNKPTSTPASASNPTPPVVTTPAAARHWRNSGSGRRGCGGLDMANQWHSDWAFCIKRQFE